MAASTPALGSSLHYRAGVRGKGKGVGHRSSARDGTRLCYIRGRKNVSRHVPPAGVTRRMATTQFAGTPGRPDVESTCINATATGERLLQAYPNVSRAALHLDSAWPSHLARNCESRAKSIFRAGTSRERKYLRE